MRMLIASERAGDADQAAAMVEACALESIEVERFSLDSPKAPREPIELLLFVAPPSEALTRALNLGGENARRVPHALLCAELTADASLWAARAGAHVCLFAHGEGPLKETLLGASRRFAEDRAQARGRALVNVAVTDVVFSLRVEGHVFRFDDINPAFTKATGLTRDQVLGKRVDEIIPEPSRSLVLWKYREAIEQRRTVRWDEVTEYPTGKKHGQVSVTPILDADGHCTMLLGTVHDVTEERNRAEMIQRYADITAAIQIGLTVWKLDEKGGPPTLEIFNPAAEHIGGVSLSTMRQKSLAEIFPPAMATPLPSLLEHVARRQKEHELPEVRFVSAPERVLSVKAFPLSGELVGLAFEDITDQARARAITALERRTLEMVAGGFDLRACLTQLVLDVEALAPPAIASVLLMSSDGKRVKHGAAPHLDEAYNRAIDGLPIGPREGSCGTAAATRKSVVVTDIETDPNWEKYRALAHRHSLRACWSTPIIGTGDRVLGTFALYYRAPRAPSPADLALIERATHVAGIAISRHLLDEELRALSARLEAAREEERTGIARELHDQLGQSLTALKLELAWISRRTNENAIEVPALQRKLEELMLLTDGLVEETRRISSELRPPLLDDVGLDAALAWQARAFEQRSQIACAVSYEAGEISREVGTAVFRVFQEALTNVVRHSHARHVEARLFRRDGGLIFTVRDDGDGIAPGQAHDPRSLGLAGIRERARRLGGTASFEPALPRGTQVTLWLPDRHEALS
jgi:PAS domain S-box-containing protein